MTIELHNDLHVRLFDAKNDLLIDRRGASLVYWRYEKRNLLREPSADPFAVDSKYTGRDGASYVVPGYFGRVPGACIDFEGKKYSIPEIPWETNALHQEYRLHGFGPFALWNISRHSENSVRLETPKDFLPKGYPFPYDSWVDYSLAENGDFKVEMGISAKKRGPYSLTWHPFFLRSLNKSAGHLKMQFEAEKVEEIPACWEYSKGLKEVLAPYDSSYAGWDGKKGALMSWPTEKPSELRMKMTSNGECLHLFTNLSACVCIEPSLTVANGFTLAEQGLLDRKYAGVLLEEGESAKLLINHSLSEA
jgi:galactose mutarotase-like enzyme